MMTATPNYRLGSLRLALLGALVLAFTPAVAVSDVVWPAYYLAAGLVFTHAIVIGLALEWPVVRIVTGRSWRGSVVPTLVINLISATLGGVVIAVAGIMWEVLWQVYLVQRLSPGAGTFNPVTWVVTAVLAVIINSVVEAWALRGVYSVGNFRRSFHWLLAANSASVAVAMLFVYGL